MLSPLTILFRADGHARMGLGHLYRSAALAAMLRPRYHCRFVCRHVPDAFRQRFQDDFPITILEEDDDRGGGLVAFLEQQTEHRIGAVVLDGYHFGTPYQRAVRDRGIPLVCIDDIHAAPFVADLVINHAPGGNLLSRYRDYGATTYALGPDFALLRPAYLEAARQPFTYRSTGSLVVCFGGSDHRNVTAAVVRGLTAMGLSRPLDLVLGAANPHGEAVEEAARHYAGEVRLHRDLADQNLIRLYRVAAACLLPASTTLMEALACGARVIGGYYVDNQEAIYDGFLARGLIVGVGDWNQTEQLAAAVRHVLTETAYTPPRGGVDPYSDTNLRLAIIQVQRRRKAVVSRPAGPRDCRQYFEWVNEAAVRRSAIRQEAIGWEEHRAWFQRKLADSDSLLLVFQYERVRCAQVRFERVDGEAEIDVSVDAAHRGRGLGPTVLFLAEEQLRARWLGVDWIVALVRPENEASKRSFLRAGYLPAGQEVRAGVSLLKYRKQVWIIAI